MWYKKGKETILTELESNEQRGLSHATAKRQLQRYGPNTFQKRKPPSLLKMLWDQINNILIYILITAAIISGLAGEMADALIIISVIILNAVIGIIQESKAERALEELEKMATPKAIVKREGQLKEIPSEELVPGDIVLLDAGRYVPADLVLLDTVNLKVEESSLTGESVPVHKNANWHTTNDTPLGDRKNMAFMSTLVTYGRGTGIIVQTGMNTEIGKIARLLDKKEKEMTPLQQKLDELGKILGIGAIIISAIIFAIGFFQGREPLEMFLIAVSLAVAAIPEGLPAIVTIVLALGVRRMIKRNAIIRKLPAVETLGAVSVICSDKTGTLTENKMTVTEVVVNHKRNPLTNFQVKDPTEKRLFQSVSLCNDAVVTAEEKTGDPTEIALIKAADKVGYQKATVNKRYPRIDEIPFDSNRKMMTTIHQYNTKKLVIVKGALERILPRLSYIENKGTVIPFTNEERKKVVSLADAMSADALRVLAVAYKIIDENDDKKETIEEKLIFLGLTGMIDPPRAEVKSSIIACKNAGIQTVMITGDHQKTALSIAKALQIAEHEDETMTGKEIDAISQSVLREKVKHIRVFARVSPEHKVRIVQALKDNGKIVSMTGDGVNDAPSLQEANVGVAMGMTGTDVAKGAADIVLADDNFATIVAAVEEGRNIYKNIKKSILFLLSCNLGEIVALFIAILMGWPAPLTAVHILWVNLITDTLPAIALGIDPDDPDIMKEQPRNVKERIFSKGNGMFTIGNGLLIGLLTLIAFMEGLRYYTDANSIFVLNFSQVTNKTLIHAQTMAFLTLSISQLFHALNVRHQKKSIFQVGLFSNRLLIIAILLGLALQVCIIHIPIFADLFTLYPLSLRDWIFIIGLSIVPILVNEIVKAFRRTIA